LHLGFSDKSIPMSDSLYFLYAVAADFIKTLSRNADIEFLREKSLVKPEEEDIERIINSALFINGREYLDRDWILNVWDRLNNMFSEEIKGYKGSVAEYFTSHSSVIHLVGRVFFHLVESKKDEYPFAFLATYSTGVSGERKSRHLPLKSALIEYKGDKNKLLELLSTVNKASSKSGFISELVESGEIFHPLQFTAQEAYTFLREIPLYEEAGILCRIPDWWKHKSNSLKISISIGDNKPSRVGLEALVDFNVKLSISGETITAGELKKILSEAEGLAFIKGKWVEVDHEKLRKTLEAYEQAQKNIGNSDMSIIEAMRFQMDASKIMNIPEKDCEIEVTNGEWLKTVISGLTQHDRIETVSCGRDFSARLRPYQQKGVAWLNFMKSLGLGACLADDMGLGKTIQVLALLNHIRTGKV